MDAGEILGIHGHDLDQVIGSAGHQVAFQDVGHAGHLAFKGVKQILGLGLQRDLDKDGGRAAHAAGVQQGDIGGDIPLLLQPLHAAVAGRGRQVDLV